MALSRPPNPPPASRSTHAHASTHAQTRTHVHRAARFGERVCGAAAPPRTHLSPLSPERPLAILRSLPPCPPAHPPTLLLPILPILPPPFITHAGARKRARARTSIRTPAVLRARTHTHTHTHRVRSQMRRCSDSSRRAASIPGRRSSGGPASCRLRSWTVSATAPSPPTSVRLRHLRLSAPHCL